MINTPPLKMNTLLTVHFLRSCAFGIMRLVHTYVTFFQTYDVTCKSAPALTVYVLCSNVLYQYRGSAEPILLDESRAADCSYLREYSCLQGLPQTLQGINIRVQTHQFLFHGSIPEQCFKICRVA
jgi:hypothetical protein